MPLPLHHRSRRIQRKIFIQRRSNSANEKKILTDVVNRMGVGRLFDRKRKIRVRIAWLCITLLCTVGCLNHIALRVSEFIDNPVAIDLHLQHRSQIFFPTVTLCSGILGNLLKENLDLWQRQKMCIADKTKCGYNVMNNYDFLFKPVGQAETDRWFYEYGTLSPRDISIEEPCSPLKNIGHQKCKQTNFPIKFRHVMTLWGSCVGLTFPNPMPYRGSFTGFTLKLDTTITNFIKKISLGDWEYYFFLHQGVVSPRHDAPYIAQAVKVGYKTTVRIFVQEYEFFNSWKKPCVTEREAVECNNICFDKIMENNVTCSLPFIFSDILKPCATYRDFFHSFQSAYQVYSTFKGSDCQCKSKCKKIVYKMSKSEEKLESQNFTHIALSIPQNSYETIVENPVFSQSALLSEIGGTLGLYLGLNMMKIYEVMEILFHVIWMSVKKQ